jgi:hypothetical protein
MRKRKKEEEIEKKRKMYVCGKEKNVSMCKNKVK